MRNWLAVVLFAVVAGAGLYWSLRPPQRAAHGEKTVPLAGLNPSAAADFTEDGQATGPTSTAPVQPAEVPGQEMSSALATNASSLGPVPDLNNSPQPDIPATSVLENMRTTIRQYGAMFGGNPVGTNPEITRALMGNNPKHINFLKDDGNRVNSNGELVDGWGTPYFFHQLSGSEMEIRSAGPDRKMWTTDDLVVK
jgi:hypothetical protein